MDIDGIYYCSKCMRKVDDDTQICPHCNYDPANVTVNSQHLAEGTFLNDRYLLGAVIGAGGFGVTYAAWDENLSVPVAIKEYFPVKYAYRNIEESDELLPHEESRGLFALGLSRFRKEAQVLAQFQNVPGIVNINECFDENETAYIAMEFVHGMPLDEYVREHHPSPKKLLEIMLPAINALEIIHRQGINHRDIKPENLLVQEDGSIKLIDFGSAREVEHVTDLIVVSDGYAPLEQYDLKQPQGPWVDVYGISATIYHMLTDVMPESSISRAKHDTLKPPCKMGVKLKKYQENALMAGLAVDPKKRIQSIAEFRALLYNMPLPEEVRRRKAFVRKAVSVVVVIILLMAAVFVNFSCGFPLGEGLLYSLYPDGWHVVNWIGRQDILEIPESLLGHPVTTMDVSVFSANDSLRQITIPDSVTQLDLSLLKRRAKQLTICGTAGSTAESSALDNDLPFLAEGMYSYAHVDDGVELSQMILRDGALPENGTFVCPSYIDGIPVVSLGENFSFPPGCRNVVLPTYLQTICPNLFDNTNGDISLDSIDLGQCLVSIPDYAFAFQTLSTIQLPDTVTSIGTGAFIGSNIRRIDLPESLKEIGEEAFFNSQLAEVQFSFGIETIGDRAFAQTPLTTVDFPESIVEIGEQAFAATQISELVLKINLDYLGDAAFANCKNLRTAVITGISADANSPSKGVLPSSLFAYCSLYEVTLKGVIREIEQSCFIGNEELYWVSLPEGLQSIWGASFSGCSSLQRIITPDTVKFISPDAFDACNDVQFVGTQNSEAERFAYQNGLQFDSSLFEFHKKYNDHIPAFALAEGLTIFDVMDDAFKNDPEAQCQLALCYLNGDGISQDYYEAFKWFLLASRQGNAEAQYNLASMYSRGDPGIPWNHDEAAKWCNLAAGSGDSEAQALLASMYRSGFGVPQSETMMLNWYLAAAEQGHAGAQGNVDLLFLNGSINPKIDEVVFERYLLIARKGMSTAQLKLAKMYYTGTDVIQSYQQAFQWFRLAADQGDSRGQYYLGLMYIKGLGVPKNVSEATNLFRLAAEQGHAGAQAALDTLSHKEGLPQDIELLTADEQFHIGMMYYSGEGATRDYEIAKEYFHLAADKGHREAQYYLGKMYYLGFLCSDQRYEEAVFWFEQAACQGHADAQYLLGYLYFYDVLGSPDHYTLSSKWFRSAAIQGHADAQYFLAVSYYQAAGVPKDDQESAKWYSLAIAQDVNLYDEKLEKLLR